MYLIHFKLLSEASTGLQINAGIILMFQTLDMADCYTGTPQIDAGNLVQEQGFASFPPS